VTWQEKRELPLGAGPQNVVAECMNVLWNEQVNDRGQERLARCSCSNLTAFPEDTCKVHVCYIIVFVVVTRCSRPTAHGTGVVAARLPGHGQGSICWKGEPQRHHRTWEVTATPVAGRRPHLGDGAKMIDLASPPYRSIIGHYCMRAESRMQVALWMQPHTLDHACAPCAAP
jgi:hypothetical protein